MTYLITGKPVGYVHVHLAPHSHPEHLDAVKPLFNGADIYVPELFGWTDKTLRDFTAIAKGDRKALIKECASDTNFTALVTKERLGMLFKSWKPVLFIDANKEEADKIDHLHVPSGTIGVTDPLEYRLHVCADNIADIVQRTKQRDNIMITRLGTAATALMAQHPKLKKEKVQTLIVLGSDHQAVPNHLSQVPWLTRRITKSEFTHQDTSSNQLTVSRAYEEGKAPTRQQILIAYAEIMIGATPSPYLPGEKCFELSRYERATPDPHVPIVYEAARILGDEQNGDLDFLLTLSIPSKNRQASLDSKFMKLMADACEIIGIDEATLRTTV